MRQIILQGIDVHDLKELLLEAVEEKFKVLVQSDQVLSSSVHSNENKYLSRRETAKMLKVSLPTLNEWTKQGKIKAYRIGSRVLYKPENIENSLSQAYNFELKRR